MRGCGNRPQRLGGPGTRNRVISQATPWSTKNMLKRILIQVLRGLLAVLERAAANVNDGDLAERVRRSGEW